MYHLFGALIILLSIGTESQLMLSPLGDVSVCTGSRISFRCSTNLTFLQWIITISQSGRLQSKRQVITAKTTLSDLDLIVGGHVFNITKSSAYNSHPLESVLTIANATTTLTATKINCTESSLNSLERSSSIAIIDIINTHPDPPDVSAPRILEFRTDGIIVLIDWNQNQYNENVAYIVDVIPQVTVTFINSTSTKLLVSYNIQYNINITAILCGHSSATVTVTLRKFVKCVHPLNLPMIDESVRASLETDPPLMETNATFSCLPGLVFRGPYMSTCMENGEWEPDPRKAECLVDCNPPSLPSNGIIYPYTSTIEGAVVNFVCQKSALDLEENVSLAVCNKHGKWDPNPAEFCASSNQENLIISVAVVSSTAAMIIALLLFIIGFYRGCHCQKQRKVRKRKKPRPRKPTPPPKELYYNLRPSVKQDSGMELSRGMQPKRPVVMYDDVIPRSKRDSGFDLLEKPKRPVAMYDDILSPSEQDLKEQNVTKPKVMYDEVLPPSEQDQVELKKNTAYRPADMIQK